jgi:hypothetical protein
MQETTETKLIVTDHRFPEMQEEKQQEVSTEMMVMTAMEKGMSPELIEKMMTLAERRQANIARQAYYKSMAAFKASPPKVWRDMQVKYGSGVNATSWSHSDLGIAGEAINKALGEHGLNSTWRTGQLENGNIEIICILSHILGHSESTALNAPPDTSGSKNAIQAMGSTIFYLERYTLFAITGLAPARMDDDGSKAGNPDLVLSEAQAIEIDKMLTESGKDAAKFLAYFDADTINDIKANKYAEAVKFLKAAIKNKEAKS